MTDVEILSNKIFRGLRHGKMISVKLIRTRSGWQASATYYDFRVVSNTYASEDIAIETLHWNEFD